MKIEQLQSMHPVFKSKIIKTQDIKDFQYFLHKNSLVTGVKKDYKHHKIMFDEIVKAFRKFPSLADLSFSIRRADGEPMNARGVVSTKFAEFVDTEPTKNDKVAPIFCIVKRILHPENKSQLGRLMGESPDNLKETEAWWRRYISPIWRDVDKYFQETSGFEPKAQTRFNAEFRSL